MTRTAARLAIAALLLLGACRRQVAEVTPQADSSSRGELPVRREVDAAGMAAPAPKHSGIPLLLTQQPLSPELRVLVARGHDHRAVSSLEAAGCDLALVMTGADEERFFELRRIAKYGVGNDNPVPFDPRMQTVRCQTLAEPVNCAVLALIFARVARPKHPFLVYSGGDPPFNDSCAGFHDAKGKYLSGEGPGYPDRKLPESDSPAR